jgi:hypothetical protein
MEKVGALPFSLAFLVTSTAFGLNKASFGSK